MSIYSALLETLRRRQVPPDAIPGLYQAAVSDPEVRAALTEAAKENWLAPGLMSYVRPLGLYANAGNAQAPAAPQTSNAQLAALQGGPLGGLTGAIPPGTVVQVPYQPTYQEGVDRREEAMQRARWEGLQDGIAMAKKVDSKEAAWDAFAAAGIARGLDAKDAAEQADELLKLRAERHGDA